MPSKTSLQGEVEGLRKANEVLRGRVAELDARLLRAQMQAQRGLAEAEAKVVELRIALAARLQVETAVAEERAGIKAPAGQVAGPNGKG